MRTREEIENMIKDIESCCDPFDEDGYLDEGQQATLMTLYWVLGNENI